MNFVLKPSILSLFIINTFSQPVSPLYLLEHYYTFGYSDSLINFFEQWNRRNPPIDSSDYNKLNDTVKDVYDLFYYFYSPLDIDSLGGTEFGSKIYFNSKTAIIQNQIIYCFTDKVYYTEEEKTEIKREYIFDDLYFESKLTDLKQYNIEDFRPLIKYKNLLPVFLNDDYYKIISRFMGDDYIPLGELSIMQPAVSKGESSKRKKFFESCAAIFYGHWGGYWQLITYPQVNLIVFDKEMKYAKVFYRIIYRGGEALMMRENNQWVIKEAKLTWIE